ncbi:lysophospholipid acyltransferase family protein [Ruminococcus sp.]|uniref:lysophospholipid acyltransferase family protein n=1 Tax=Ruminococcus sp. TaxID=41978 RepID=UPI00386670B9
MFICLLNWFVKITGWPIQLLCFRKKIYYEDKAAQSRRIKGKAILISNHLSVYDYPLAMFVFFGRTLRFQMSELVMKKPVLGAFLRMLGGICVDRDSHDFGFMAKCEKILDKGGVVGICPEGRLPLKDEPRPLPFKTGSAYLALMTDTPIIPMVTNGSYFNLKERARVIIGTPIIPSQVVDPERSDKENIAALTELMRNKTISLGKKLHEQRKK